MKDTRPFILEGDEQIMPKECDMGCPLQSYFESRLNSLDKQMDIRIAAANAALELANKTTDRRLDDLNHVREQLREQNLTFLSRETYEVQHQGFGYRLDQMNAFFNNRIDMLRDKEEALEKLAANLQGRMWMLTACLGAGFTIVQFLIHFFIK